MDALRNRVGQDQKKTGWLPVVFIVLLCAAIVAIMYRYKGESRFAVVKLNGEGSSINMSKCYDLVFFGTGKSNKGSVLAEAGDVLGFNNTLLSFNDVTKDSLQVYDDGDSLIFVNGKINTIVISDETNLLPWFQTMQPSDIDALETISFTSVIPGKYIPYLKEIARLQPATALAFEEDDSLHVISDYIKQANFFAPLFVRASLTQDELPLLAHWKTAECIYLDIEDSVITSTLPAMPALKQCIIYGDYIISMDASFFSNNRQIEKLTLLGEMPGYAIVQPLNNLQQLIINNTAEDTADITVLKSKLNKLTVFIASGNYYNIDSPGIYKNLRWLGLPANTSQQQFNTIAAQLKGLQVLEMRGSDSVTSLKALQQLTNLHGLVITDTVTDKSTLFAMKQLRYLSVPDNNEEDSAYMLALQKALPGCIIVPNGGACLGSGWLLMLVPLVLLFSFMISRMFQKKAFQSTSKHEAS